MLDIAMTMGEAIRQVARERPDQEVLVCGERRFSNRQLLESIEALARGLRGIGIAPGDRIVVLLPPGPEFAFLFFAAATIGAVVVPLDPEAGERTLSEVLQEAEPRAVVASHPVADDVLRPARGLRHVIRVGGDGGGPALEGLMRSGDAEVPAVLVGPEDLLVLLYTSGTTGKPKATMHTHRSLMAPLLATLKVRALWMRPASPRTMVDVAKAVTRYPTRLLRSIGRPQTFLSTIAGWHTISGLHLLFQGLLMGDRLVVMPRFRPQEALELVERERVTILVAVPTAFQAMLGLPDFDRYDISSLLVCGTGAAPCPPPLGRQIKRRFGCALYIGFGMTESAGAVSISSLADSDALQVETVGRPMPGVEMRIVDENRRDLPRGEVGELAVRGGGVMLGYYHAPELTSRVIDEEGWLYTGDLATIDKKGYLRIVGRKKDLIIRGGQNIYPAEIEGHLLSHPKIGDAAVVGVPSGVAGESVWAYVRLKEGAQMTAQEVLDHCRGILAAYQIPSEVRFVSELPQGEPGKSQKFKLRAMAIEEKGGAP